MKYQHILLKLNTVICHICIKYYVVYPHGRNCPLEFPNTSSVLFISPELLVQIHNNLRELFLMIPSFKIAQMVWLRQSSRSKISLNGISSRTIGPNSKYFHRVVPYYSFNQNFIDGFVLPNNGATRALDKKCL